MMYKVLKIKLLISVRFLSLALLNDISWESYCMHNEYVYINMCIINALEMKEGYKAINIYIVIIQLWE